MVASVLTCLFFIFFLPCFSNSCTTTLPCRNSIQIKSPFSFQSDITKGPNCQGNLTILCAKDKPFLEWIPNPLPLENISYENKTITIQDPFLSSSLKTSGCGNLYFNFCSPINLYYGMYGLWNSSLASVRCDPITQIQSPPKIFGKDYNLSYSPILDKNHKPPPNCQNSQPSLEYIYSFNDNGQLSLLSISYSGDLLPQPGCIANWIEVVDPEDGKALIIRQLGMMKVVSFVLTLSFKYDNRDHSVIQANYSNHLLPEPDRFANITPGTTCDRQRKGQYRTRIITGCVVGFSTFVLAFGGLLLFFYKQKKLRFISSSSKSMVQRQDSDQYFHDLEMVGSEYTQIFSYEELHQATEGFSKSKKLGDGGFGIVYKGILKDGRTVAVKRLYNNSYKSTEQFMNEVEILSRLHHPNLVTLYGSTACSGRELLLVFEFVPNGTVADHLHRPRSTENALSWSVRLSVAIETANALAYLHAVEPPIIHRDVKTNNILLDDAFHVKVGDFGLSRLFPLNVTHVSTVPVGTPGYVDPVYYQCYHLTDKSDVYSFGVVLIELISSKQAVDLSRSKDEINLANLALNKIQRCQLDELVDPALGISSNWEVWCMVSLVAELAFRCLQPDREMRPSIKEVLETLKVIEKSNYNGDKMVKENMIKEEAYLLKGETNFSSHTMTGSGKSSSTTPNPSR